MGAAVPVLGAVTGVMGAVQQSNAQKQQAAAQRNALDQQALAEQNNTQLRLMELERQKNYSDFQFQIDTARREIQKVNDASALQIAGLQDTQNQQSQQFANQQNTLQQRTANQELLGAASQEEAGAKSQALGILTQESEQGRQKQIELANMGAALNADQVQKGLASQQAMAQLTGQGQAGVGVSDTANLANLALSSNTSVQEFLQQYGNIVDQVTQGGTNAQAIANIVNQLGAGNAAFLRDSSGRADKFLQDTGQFNQQSIDATGQMNRLGLQAAQGAQNTAYAIEEGTSALNRSYYDLQRQSQQGAISTAGNAIQTQIANQRSAIVQPGSLGVLSAALSAYPTVQAGWNSMTKPYQAPKQSYNDFGSISSYSRNTV